MKYHGFDVIDVNHRVRDADLHLNTEIYEFVTTAFEQKTHASADLQSRLATMDAQQVRAAILIAGAGYLRPRGLTDTVAVNDALAGYRDQAPTRFVAAVGHVDPLYGVAGVGEVRRCAEELGMRGVIFHGMGFMMRPLVKAVAELGLVPFVRVGTPSETIWQVDSLAEDFPKLPIIVLNLFHAIDQMGALAAVAKRHPNLYFDLSGSMSFETLGLPHLRRIGADRFLYGTGTQSWPIQTRPFGEMLPDIVASDLTEADKTAILSGNIRRLLDI